MRVLHVNERIHIAGGVETFIDSLMNRWSGNDWIAISYNSKGIEIERNKSQKKQYKSLDGWAKSESVLEKFEFVFIHSVSSPRLIGELQSLGLPLVRVVHEPRMFCPGHAKYLWHSETTCDKPFGYHCLLSAYHERCAPRDPKRLARALSNSFWEQKSSSSLYTLVVCMSHFMYNQMSEAGFGMNNVRVIPYFVNGEIGEIKMRKSKTIVYAGRLIKHKGVHVALEAIAPLLLGDQQLTFQVIGTGMDNYERSMKKRSVELGIARQVQWLGWQSQSEVQEHISQASVLVFPSLYPEAFGIVGIEAMSKGVPVVAFNVGGVSSWLEDNVTGFLLNAVDIEGMSRSINTLLTDVACRKRMGEAAISAAKCRFTFDVFNDVLTNALRDVTIPFFRVS